MDQSVQDVIDRDVINISPKCHNIILSIINRIMLSRGIPKGLSRIGQLARPISTEAKVALDLAHQQRLAAFQAEANIAAAKAKADQATLNAYRKEQEALREVEKSRVEAESILRQKAAYSKPRNTGTSSNSSKGPSVDPKSDPDWNFMGLLAAILLSAGYAAFHTISEEDAKKENEAVKSDLDKLIVEGPDGLIRLDGEIYDALYALKSSGFDTAVSESLKKKLVLFRAGLTQIPLSSAPAAPRSPHPELTNVRVDTVGDALKLMEQYRIIIGSSQPAVWFEWATLTSLYAKRREKNTSKMPNGKNLYELAARFQSINPFSSQGRSTIKHVSKVLNEMPLQREMKGGRKRKTRRNRKSRKSRKNRK